MSSPLRTLTLKQWDERYVELQKAGLREPVYGGRLSRHLEDGDLRPDQKEVSEPVDLVTN